MNSLNLETFQGLDANPGGTLQKFHDYVERIELLFQLCFRKADGTAYDPSDNEKKAMLLFKGGRDMKNLFQHVGKVLATDSYVQTIDKIKGALSIRTNNVVQRNMLLSNFPQGSKTFEKWSQEISDAAKLINYDNYDYKQATVDAIILQTSNPRLRERGLQDNVTYDALMTLGIAKEQSAKGAALLEQASGQTSRHSSSEVKIEEEVRRLRIENKQLKDRPKKGKSRFSKKTCTRCGTRGCSNDDNCPAEGRKCVKCGKLNHFAKVCHTPGGGKKVKFGKMLSSADESASEESSGCILVGNLNSSNIAAKVYVNGPLNQSHGEVINLATDTGISKTILNCIDWNRIRSDCKFVKTSKRFRPYGTAYHLPIKGKAQVTLTAERGAAISTWIYVNDDPKEQSLLGEQDAIRLGIVTLNLKGGTEEVTSERQTEEVMRNISYIPKSTPSGSGTISGGETQSEIDKNMTTMMRKFPKVFSDRTGKYCGPPIKIQIKPMAVPVIQPPRRVPLQYLSRLKKEIGTMLQEDIIEGPIMVEEPGTFLSNLVIAEKKGSDKIRVTLDCQDVNKEIYATHEPIPTTEELRHQLTGSDRFSTLDMTNCYHQFQIEESARKLYSFRTPWGIYRYKRMVMGTSPASSEIQKKIRGIISGCGNAIHIKDDILVHGIGSLHDMYLEKVLQTLRDSSITLRWFGNIYSKQGMSPDPDKCAIIRNWPAPTSCTEVKSFLQTVQFNAKFLGGEPGGESYPELTAPLRSLTKKGARFIWGQREKSSFQEIKNRLCSNRVLTAYDTVRKTRLYVDSSPIGTQATLAQAHFVDGEMDWRPVNYTSRAWTSAEAGYGQIERESNGILTGMFMNKMYTLGTHVEVVTDHEPLISIYNSSKKPKQLRVNSHRIKLLPFDYNVVYEAGRTTPSDYGSRHPPNHRFTQKETEEWCIDEGKDIHVNRLIEESLPPALTLEILQKATAADKELQKLLTCVKTRDKQYCKRELKVYHGVFDELSEINGLVVRGHQIVIPSTLRADAIGLSHEGHQYADKTLQFLRETCWFPKMYTSVNDYVESCRGCNAAATYTTPVPLEPNLLPDRPWQELHADFKGPIGGEYYLHVVIDQFSKYPEVDILTSTSFKKLKPVLDRIFATHGIPEKVSTDNGPPYPSHDMEQYAAEKGFEIRPVSPNDPQCNGFAEKFVQFLCKMLHTSVAEGKDPKSELYNYLLTYRATPHCTTGLSPAELLFNRKLQTKLPQVFMRRETNEMKEVRDKHDAKKLKQKQYFDKRHRAHHKEINVGDNVLVKQKKTTLKPPFEAHPYTVTDVNGNRVRMEREDGSRRVRDKNQIRKLKPRPPHLIPSWNSKHTSQITDYSLLEIEGPIPSNGDDRAEDPVIGNDDNNDNDDNAVTRDRGDANPDDDDVLFDISESEEVRMNALIEAVLQCSIQEEPGDETMEENQRVTRSRGVQLAWNPIMNSSDVLLRREEGEQ